MRNMTKRSLAALSVMTVAMSASAAQAQRSFVSADGRWEGVSEIVGQTSTATLVGGGDPIYIPAVGQYTGSVGLLMDYGAGGAFVCSGSLVGRSHIITAAHCVSDGTSARPNSVTAFFTDGAGDPVVYAAGAPNTTTRAVSNVFVNSLYSGEVVDENDIAVLRLGTAAPTFAQSYQLSPISDLTGVDHIISGFGVRSDTGGSIGSNLGTGRRRYAGNRFDFRFGDSDFNGYFDGAFGPQSIDNVWISDFDNGTAFRDGSCNIGIFEGFSDPVFTSGKYCNTGIGAFEGIGGGGDSGSGYYTNGKLTAVHSFALWYRDDESNNRFGQLKGAVSIDFQRQFINSSILAAVPEPATWAMMIAGFGLAGTAVRRSNRAGVRFA